MSRPIRVGLVSTSWWADRMHVPAIQSHEAAELVACCGRDLTRTEDFAQKHSIPAAFSNYQEMIDRAQLDVLVIATPESSRHEICMAAVQAGLHVVCEKPVAMNADQAGEMLSSAESAGVKHMTFFTYRWIPWIRYTKQLVDGGFVGRIYEARLRSAGGYGRSGVAHWKWDRRYGLGILGDLGSHAIDLAHWIVGPIVDVDARIANHVSRAGFDGDPDPSSDSALLTVGFEGGAQASIQVSAIQHLGSLGMEWQIELYGELGSIRVEADLINGWRAWAVSGEDEGGDLKVPDALLEGVDVDGNIFTQLTQLFTRQSVGTRLFIDSILEDRPVEPSLRDGYRAQLVMDAAIESNNQQKRVAIPPAPGSV